MKQFKFKISGNNYSVNIKSFEDNVAEVEVNGTTYKVEMEQEVKTTKTPKLVRSAATPVQKTKPLSTPSGLKKIEAPLPGNIFKILKKEGDEVKKGETLLIMEAMKMENNILAEKTGVIRNVKVKEGDAVLQGDVLVEIE